MVATMPEACYPIVTERGCPTRSSRDCHMSARNPTGFEFVQRAAAETAALRRLKTELGDTLPGRARLLLTVNLEFGTSHVVQFDLIRKNNRFHSTIDTSFAW